MPSVAEAAAAIVAAKMLGPISESMKFESKLMLIKLRVKSVRNSDALLVQALANAQSVTPSRRSRSEKRPIPLEQKDVRYAYCI